MRCRATFAAAVCAAAFGALLLSDPPLTAQGEGLSVTFLVNDATVKDRVLAGATVQVARDGEVIVRGTTGEDGRFTATLAAGTYQVSYGLAGHVPVPNTEVEVRGDGQIVTTTLSQMLEATQPDSSPAVRIILNWGSEPSQVRDADSHLYAASLQPTAHVYYGRKQSLSSEGSIDLDVDDTDWGGPETITLRDLPPGSYDYWVHNYSDEAPLGKADIVVRVVFEDAVQAEYRIPSEVDERNWRPMKALVVDADLRPRIVAWTATDVANDLDHEIPAQLEVTWEGDGALPTGCLFLFVLLAVVAIALLIHVRRR